MPIRIDKLDPLLAKLDAALVAAAPNFSAAPRAAVERWRADAAAARFHIRRNERPHRTARTLLAVVGGTGTGKSTLVNRLLGHNLSAASFRRTFTSGPVAIAPSPDDLPEGWLGIEHVTADPAELPARGRPGALIVVTAAPPAGGEGAFPVLIDTPDLDGDQPAHHAQADRVFRWADAVLFLVTPEKYQMTELLPYYRLAARYGVPTVYVMNKVEEQAVLDDYRGMLARSGAAGAGPFAVARDDAGYEPPADANLSALKGAIADVRAADPGAKAAGLRNRAADLLGRLTDQVIAPLREDRREADRLAAALRSMETPAAGVDVNPLTQSLQRRMQQRSILYLMGPQRILDRVRQAPGLLVRLPRVAWDYMKTGEIAPGTLSPAGDGSGGDVPDFAAMLTDQFAVLQSRIDDALRSGRTGERWVAEPGYASARVDPAEAGKIAAEELAALRDWLERRWNATPRDTKVLETLLKYLPGGTKLARWSEAAPYLLTIVLVTHGAIFGHIDLLVLGGYSLATWLTERISNEVASRTRATNARIADRFTRLAHDQIERTTQWLDRQAPSAKTLDQLERLGHEAQEVVA